MKTIKHLKVVLLSLAFIFIATNAFAISYTLNVSASNGSGPFGEVVLSETAADTVKVEVNMSSGYAMMQAGAKNTMFEFNLSILGTPTIIVDNSAGTSFVSLGKGSYAENDFGTFEYAIFDNNHNTKYWGSGNPVLTFTVTASGLTIASFEELSTNPPGSKQGYFALHVYAENGGATFTVSNGPPQVPEPITLLLLGFGIVGLAGLRKLKK